MQHEPQTDHLTVTSRHAGETPAQRAKRIAAVQAAVRNGTYNESTNSDHAAEIIIAAVDGKK